MEVPHKNYNLGFKEAITLFKDKALDFFGIDELASITEPLATESVQVEVKSLFRDLVFATKEGKGLHFEEEVNLSPDDLLRFLDYNISLRRIHKRVFDTVIFVKEPTDLTGINEDRLIFKPIIVQCSEIDADAMLEELKKDIAEGKSINELKLIYLPLFRGRTLDATGLFLESTKLIRAMKSDEEIKRKVFTLAILISGKVVDSKVLDKIYEEVMMMSTGNVILDYAENRGAEREKEETARRMLADRVDPLDIIKYTGISAERLSELRNSLRNEAV